MDSRFALFLACLFSLRCFFFLRFGTCSVVFRSFAVVPPQALKLLRMSFAASPLSSVSFLLFCFETSSHGFRSFPIVLKAAGFKIFGTISRLCCFFIIRISFLFSCHFLAWKLLRIFSAVSLLSSCTLRVNAIDNFDMRGRVVIYEYLFCSAASAVRSHPRVPPSEEADIFPLELH